jgi:hypothetical protein
MQESRQEGIKKRILRNKEFLYAIKLCCVDCGWDKVPQILEFHHEKNKENDTSLSSLINSACSVERLLEEIDKGCFLCPTCHRLRHYNKDTQRIQTNNPELR